MMGEAQKLSDEEAAELPAPLPALASTAGCPSSSRVEPWSSNLVRLSKLDGRRRCGVMIAPRTGCG